MRSSVLIVLLLAGCNTSTASVPDRSVADRLAFAADLERLTVTSEASTEAVQQQVALLTAIRDEVAKINAVPLPTEKEVIPESDPVEVPPVVDDRPELCVTYADFHCPPCERLRDAVAGGKLDAFRVRETPGFDGLKGYPAIRYESPSGSGKWVQVNGFDSTTIAGLTAKLISVDVVHKDVGGVFEPALTQQEMDAAEHLRSVHHIDADGMTLAEMEAAHDAAHGGSGYHFPGYQSLSPARSWTTSTSCPTCPTGSTRVRYGLFGRRRR